MIELSGRILLAGDWHGSFPQAEKVIRHAHEYGIATIIHLGDFGIWNNDKPYLNKMQFLLGEWGIRMYFIDGNHEDFVRLYGKRVLEDGTRFVRDNITHLPRGLRIGWEGYNILCLGGAASIDRLHRRVGTSWWPEELITDEDVENSIAGGPADILLAHDSPAGAPNGITDDFAQQLAAMRYFGPDIVRQCNEHRKQLKRVTDVVAPRLVFHGHYHMYMRGVFQHPDGRNALVVGLDQGTGSIPRHTYLLDAEKVQEQISALDSIHRSVV